MVRKGKTQMKLIEDTARRQVSMCKRRTGLLKKAFELSVLCDAEVGVVVFSPNGRLDQFSSATSLQKTIDRYRLHTNKGEAVPQDVEQLKSDNISLAKQLEDLEHSKAKILGKNFQECSAEELKSLEVEVEKRLHKIRGKKTELLEQEIVKLKDKESGLMKDHEYLRQKQCRFEAPMLIPGLNSMAPVQLSDAPESSNCDVGVDTELSIRLPGTQWESNSNRGSD